jgi:hypothetical protein
MQDKMTYKSRFSLVSNIICLFAIGMGLLVILEYIIGQRSDTIEFIVAIIFVIFFAGQRFHLSRMEVNKQAKEITLIGWFGLRSKIIKFSDVKDVYVEYGGITNQHSIIIQTKRLNRTAFEMGGRNNQKIINEVSTIYKDLVTLLGIEPKNFKEVSSA